MSPLTLLLSFLVFTPLGLFTARRWVLLAAALFKKDEGPVVPKDADLHSLLILIPVRNEISRLAGFLETLEVLDYPSEKRIAIFIDDASSDGTGTLLQAWVRDRGWAHLITNDTPEGKAAALNRGLNAFSFGSLVVVFDADARPEPEALTLFSQKFKNIKIGMVGGLREVANPLASPTASYIAFENITHQWVTMRGKSRLGLAPASLGSNCAYRRTALESVGGFTPGTFLEDSDITVRFARKGWSAIWAPDAKSTFEVATSLQGYWAQHTRWVAGFGQVAKSQTGSILFTPGLSLAMRIELLIFSSGFVDRVFLIAGILLVAAKFSAPGWLAFLAFYLLTPFFQVMAGLHLSGAPRALWLRLYILPLFFIVDIAMAVSGLIKSLLKPSGIWRDR